MDPIDFDVDQTNIDLTPNRTLIIGRTQYQVNFNYLIIETNLYGSFRFKKIFVNCDYSSRTI